MKPDIEKNYSKKHNKNTIADPVIEKEMEKRLKGKNITCVLALAIAEDLDVSPVEVGKTADILNIPLVKCQLGLFGYKPEKKIVKSENTTNLDLINTIKTAMIDQRLPCKNAFEIALQFNEKRLRVSNICQANNIRIKPCQLGAFKSQS